MRAGSVPICRRLLGRRCHPKPLYARSHAFVAVCRGPGRPQRWPSDAGHDKHSRRHAALHQGRPEAAALALERSTAEKAAAAGPAGGADARKFGGGGLLDLASQAPQW